MTQPTNYAEQLYNNQTSKAVCNQHRTVAEQQKQGEKDMKDWLSESKKLQSYFK